MIAYFTRTNGMRRFNKEIDLAAILSGTGQKPVPQQFKG
jgi:hypothetical protein